MEEDDGFGVLIWGVAEIINVTVWTETTDDRGAGRSLNGLALRANGDFAVVADTDAGLLAADIGPPRTGRWWTRDGVFFCAGLLSRGLRVDAGFPVDFVLMGVGQELVETAESFFITRKTEAFTAQIQRI